MPRIVYLNGEWVPAEQARVSVFDRGFLFGDAIYEVVAVAAGRFIDYEAHAARLMRSLRSVGIVPPFREEQLLDLHREAVARNELREGLVYLQVSRGPAERDFVIAEGVQPTILIFTQQKVVLGNPKAETGIAVLCRPDLRWGRRDIKTVQLLYASMMKSEAVRAGADDVVLVEDGFVTEASSANIHIVDHTGTLVTRELSHALLPGITRGTVLELARRHDIPCREGHFSEAEMKAAREVFATSASSFVQPVVTIDGQPVGDGRPGPVSRRMRAIYEEDSLARGVPVRMQGETR